MGNAPGLVLDPEELEKRTQEEDAWENWDVDVASTLVLSVPVSGSDYFAPAHTPRKRGLSSPRQPDAAVDGLLPPLVVQEDVVLNNKPGLKNSTDLVARNIVDSESSSEETGIPSGIAKDESESSGKYDNYDQSVRIVGAEVGDDEGDTTSSEGDENEEEESSKIKETGQRTKKEMEDENDAEKEKKARSLRNDHIYDLPSSERKSLQKSLSKKKSLGSSAKALQQGKVDSSTTKLKQMEGPGLSILVGSSPSSGLGVAKNIRPSSFFDGIPLSTDSETPNSQKQEETGIKKAVHIAMEKIGVEPYHNTSPLSVSSKVSTMVYANAVKDVR